jgi:cysteinyl-tRNA synthetase
MHWESPWGDGFPGWHIECSAMSMKYLGTTIDVHTGGIDHIPVHHENEIAQSEAANGVPFVHYWMHYHFLQVEGQKMSKSLGNFFTIDDIKKRGIEPLAFRLLLLQSHYRQPMNFTWEALQGASEAYRKLKAEAKKLRDAVIEMRDYMPASNENDFMSTFLGFLENDLQTPQAVASLFNMLKSDVSQEEKLSYMTDIDKLLGLALMREDMQVEIPKEVIELAQLRKQAKIQKEYEKADAFRKQIEEKGYRIEDAKGEYTLKKI